MKTYKPYYLITVMMAALGLTACGGGSGDGSGSGNRTTGAVTSKSANALSVAGNTYNTDSSTVSGDEIGSVADVEVGMVVSVESDDSGNAIEIDYDAEIEGIVQSVSADSMLVMGQNVDLSQNPNFHNDVEGSTITEIMNIPVDAVVEISGYSDGMGNIVATYVELEYLAYDGSQELELEGTVESLGDGTFMIGGLTIHYDPNDISLTLENGLNVEVDLVRIDADFHATEIEIEHEYHDEYGEGYIEIEGMITSGLSGGMFAINGEMVMLGENPYFEDGLTEADIVDGAMLEVEGYLNNDGVLVVHEVELPSVDEVDEVDDSPEDSSSSTL